MVVVCWKNLLPSLLEDGTMVCFGFLGIVIPFVEWDDFILMD